MTCASAVLGLRDRVSAVSLRSVLSRFKTHQTPKPGGHGEVLDLVVPSLIHLSLLRPDLFCPLLSEIYRAQRPVFLFVIGVFQSRNEVLGARRVFSVQRGEEGEQAIKGEWFRTEQPLRDLHMSAGSSGSAYTQSLLTLPTLVRP